MNFTDFVAQAWQDHGDAPAEVAARLEVEASLSLIETSEQVAPFSRLVTHVFGEHLGQWQRGIALLESVAGLRACDESPASTGPIARGIATLRFAAGDEDAGDTLSNDDRACMLASAAAIFAGRNDVARAITTLEQTAANTRDDLPGDAPAARALAVAGNNLAAKLEETAHLTEHESRAMLSAAGIGLRFWKRAGTWLEEERAEYLLARCRLRAGDAAGARTSAQACIDICEQNAAAPLELFFGHAVLALACRKEGDDVQFGHHRAAAMACYDALAENERQWCGREFGELSA